MSDCPHCGFHNAENTRICLNCAAVLNQKCRNCGAEIPPGNRFCGKCGTPAAPADSPSLERPPAAAPGMNIQERMIRDLRAKMPSSMVDRFIQGSKDLYGQRREVTVLMAEIADFPAITRTLDSETLYLAVDEIIHLLTDIVYKYEGTIDKYSGSGITALFGLPLNHENDPERAVRASLEILHSIAQLQDSLAGRYRRKFQIKIGINTGSVIAGAMGSQQHLEYTVIGDTIHLAAQLQKAAEPGSALVSFRTFQRTRPIIDFQSRPPISMDGNTEPVIVYQPIKVRVNPDQVRGLPGLQVQMVGRREQLDKLIETFTRVVDRNSSEIVFCSGEAGIGKSRLVAEFRNYLSGRQAAMVQGTCALYMRITPYRVVADVLRNILGISELDPVHEQRRVLRQHLEQFDLNRSDILPYLMHVLGILQSDPVLEVRIRLLDPAMLHRQTHFALRMFFLAQSRKAPLVLVFDDLHWVDQTSGQFLEYLCQSLDSSPILLIMVARNFENYAFAKAIRAAAEKHTHKPHHIHIQPLTQSDAQLLVDQLIQEDTRPAKEIKAVITARAGGNPYYTEELVRILIDHGGLVNRDGVWQLTPNAAHYVDEVPGTLSDIILARFDRLPDPLKNVLLRASVLGDSFSVGLLQAIMDGEDENLTSWLAELEARDFLIRTRFDIEDGYIFKHPLLSETIYKTLLKRDLRKLHTKAAQAIETGRYWLPGERNQVLAYHLSESSTPAEAIPYFLISAEKAYRNFANDTAAQIYRQALSLIETLPNPDTLQKEKALVGLAQALKFTGKLEEASQLLKSIVEQFLQNAEHQQPSLPAFQVQIDALCELADISAREGDLDYAASLLTQGKELLGEAGRSKFPAVWRRVVDRLAWVYFLQRNLDEAYNLVDLALMDTPDSETDDPITMASLYNTMGGIYWTRSRYANAIESVEHSLRIYRNLHYHWGMANSLTNLGILHYSTEKWGQAVEYLEQADQLRREYGDDPERPINLENLGEILIDMGEFAQARANLETSREISQRFGLSIAQTRAEFGLCRLAIAENRLNDARLHLQNARALIDSLDEPNDRTAQFFQLQAEIDNQEGNLLQARESAERALAAARRGNMPEKQVDALRVYGAVLGKLGDYEEAETRLLNSIELARQANDRFSEARACYEMGVLLCNWSQSGQEQPHSKLLRADRMLDTAARIFDELGAKHDLQAAKRLRDLLLSIESSSKYPPQEAAIEDQMNLLRARLRIPDGEWYQAALFTALITPKQGTDDELVFETIAFLIPPLADLVRENGGQVLNNQDGLTAVFGVPSAHEDDPERAVETMMQIINFYNELDQQTDLPVYIRLGADMGKIVAGKPGMEHASEFMVAGEPVQAARVIAEASPSGRVWVTQEVYNRTAFRFEYTPVPANTLESLPGIKVFQLEGLREQILPVRGLIGLKTPYIGREKELEAMENMSRVLEEGTGGIIWIEGEAGIGKSRLMREFSKLVIKYNPLILSGTCSSRRTDYAFSLFSDLFMQIFDIQSNFSPKQINEQISHRLSLWPADLQETRPFLQLLLGVQPGGAQGERIAAMEPEQLRRQTFVAIHRIFMMLASKQPLVLFLDDLQWIDSISADLLLYLSHLVVSKPILLVCAQRQKEISPHEQVLARIHTMHPERYIRLAIHPLSSSECRQLLDEFLASAGLPDSLLSLIVQQSGGNPYFIEEFVRLLIEKDFLRLVRGSLVANQTLQTGELTVPASLESLIRARVDALRSPARQLLQTASIIGHRFNITLLTKVAEQEDIYAILSQLHTSGMLSPTAEEGYWEFSHPLIETIVYNSILRVQRRILHERTALALESQWQGSEDEHAEDLAYHFLKAEVYERALHYLIIAGERAANRHANDVAVLFFEQAAELLNTVSNVSDEVRWRIIHQMGEVYQFIGNYETSLAILQSGLDLLQSKALSPAQRAGIYRRMGDTAHKKGDQEQAILYLEQALDVIGEPDDTPSWAEAALIYARLGWCYFMKSDLQKAEEAVNQSMVYAGMAKNVATLAMTENYLGGIYYRQGDLQKAMQHARTAMDYWQEIGYSWGVAAALSNLGILESASGNWQAAFNSIKRSLELRQKMGDVDGVAITNHNLGEIMRNLGDGAQAELYYRDSLAVSRPFQMNWHAANSYVGLAQSLLIQGKIDEAASTLEGCFPLVLEVNAPDVTAEAYCTLAEIQLARNEPAQAEESARIAAQLAEQSGVSRLAAASWRLTSASLLRQGEIHKAGMALETAWKALADSPDQLEKGRLHAQAMSAALALNDASQAQAHRKEAEKVFRHLGAAHDLALLESAGAKPNNFIGLKGI